MMEPITIKVEERKETGRRAATSMRRKGLIPANIIGQGKESIPISISPDELKKVMDNPYKRNTLLGLELNGKTYQVLVSEAQREPVKGALLHVDFYNLEEGQLVDRAVPLQLIGKAIGVQLGGSMRKLRRTLKVRCKGADLPATIDLNITPMKVNDTLKVSDLPQIEGLTYLERDNTLLVEVLSTRDVEDDGAAPAAAAK
jgi:large subunit ribosomal protein L25